MTQTDMEIVQLVFNPYFHLKKKGNKCNFTNINI